MNVKILVIEDNTDMREFLKTILEDNGYTVCVAQEYEEGLRLAEQEKPDLITLDLLLPGKTGIKLYRVFRTDKAFKNIPIIVITGFAAPAYPRLHVRKFFDEERAVRKPEAFFEKPVDEEELLAAIGKHIDTKLHSPSFND